MSLEVLSLGEILVEIMRKDLDVPHNLPGTYVGPYPSGAPAIFVDAAANLGLGSRFIGVVGEDEFGDLLLNRLKKSGVDTEYIRIAKGYTTGIAFVMYHSSGERKFIFHLRYSAAGQLNSDDVRHDYILKTKILHVMGSSLAINENVKRACYRAVEIARESGIIVTFDPNLRPELLNVETIRKICRPILKASQITFPSRDEATALTGIKNPIEAAHSLQKLGPHTVVIKMGANGALAVTKRDVIFEPAFKVKEVDPTGAGDAYDAAFLYGVLKKMSLEKTLEFAGALGALKVTRHGPMGGSSSVQEVEDFVQKTPKNPPPKEMLDLLSVTRC
jgi:sugar/nucleoside kinase (ribokinase family)